MALIAAIEEDFAAMGSADWRSASWLARFAKLRGLILAGEGALERARYLVHETQRPPYVIPETV